MIQIQPKHYNYPEWEQLSREEPVIYEAVEFYQPPVLGNKGLTDHCREWYRRSGRLRSLHGAFIDINPSSGDPAFLKLSQDRCRESCLLAREMGVDQVVFHSSAFPFLRGGYLIHWAQVCGDFYVELAHTYGLKLYIENSQDIDTIPLRVLMEHMQDPMVQVCLDIGHANYSGTALERWFKDLGQWIGYIHLSDNLGKFDDHLPLGEGTVDWKQADRLWRALDREMPITLEVASVEGARRSLAYLRKNRLFGMEE